MPYVDCRLTVRQDPVTKEPQVEYRVMSPGYQPVRAAVCHDEVARLSVERLNRWIGTHRATCEREDLRALGLHLYRILFNGPLKTDPTKTVAQVFEQTYHDFREDLKKPHAGDLRMRLTLVFEAAVDDLASYPWEFLFVPAPSERDGFFLTGERRELILTRAVSPSLVQQFEPEQNAINILVVICKPRELTSPDEKVEEEIEKLATEITRPDATKRVVHVETLANPTHEELTRRVNEFRPHIVHLIGHGKPGSLALFKTKDDLARERELVQEQRKARVEEAAWEDGNSVRAIFNTHPPRIVFLHACNSATSPDSLASFKSLAQQVLLAGVPAVVAMQYEISNDDATRFATTFYQQLGDGKSIDEAVKEGRKALAEITPAWGHPRFGTPVVYLQGDSVPIFKREADAGPTGQPEKAATGQRVDCPYDCGNTILPTAKRCSCDKRQPLKQCDRCKRPVPKNDPDCQACGFVFGQEPPPASLASAAPSAATTTGPRPFTR